jgi:hypothetical protein
MFDFALFDDHASLARRARQFAFGVHVIGCRRCCARTAGPVKSMVEAHCVVGSKMRFLCVCSIVANAAGSCTSFRLSPIYEDEAFRSIACGCAKTSSLFNKQGSLSFQLSSTQVCYYRKRQSADDLGLSATLNCGNSKSRWRKSGGSSRQ